MDIDGPTPMDGDNANHLSILRLIANAISSTTADDVLAWIYIMRQQWLLGLDLLTVHNESVK